jgi:hypothetical protein
MRRRSIPDLGILSSLCKGLEEDVSGMPEEATVLEAR